MCWCGSSFCIARDDIGPTPSFPMISKNTCLSAGVFMFPCWNYFLPRVVYCRRRERRMAFFLAIRRSSDLETNQRLRRTSLRIPALATAFRKRRNSCCCDSFCLKLTLAKKTHLPFVRLAAGNRLFAIAFKPNDFTLLLNSRQELE